MGDRDLSGGGELSNEEWEEIREDGCGGVIFRKRGGWECEWGGREEREYGTW